MPADWITDHEPTADDWAEWSDWLMQQAMTEPEPMDLTDEAYAAHQAAVLAKAGETVAPF